MRTLGALVLAVVSSTAMFAIFGESGYARAQQPAPPTTGPRQFADRATEGAGATIFGRVTTKFGGRVPPVRATVRSAICW